MPPLPARLFGPAVAVPMIFGAATGLPAQSCGSPCVGPLRGAVMAAGGGTLGDEVYEEFVRLAGGSEARIVLIPTAGVEYGRHDGWAALERLRDAGVTRLEVLHTRNRAIADLDAFAAPLRKATGVWLSGGRQWRLVDPYLNTRTHTELRNVLARGGIVGGNSAGASALASFLVRGGEENDVVATPEREEGFGFLRNVAIDQHLVARGREEDLLQVLSTKPHLLGLGLNEGAALIITRDFARVMGNQVVVYDVTDPSMLIPLRWLSPGDIYDLGARRMVRERQMEEPPLLVPWAM
ncbi:MAG: cyanophycinase [Gemmatimonadota bacterium]|nr:cyanophycinase [Gemmatimonadota bacterium]